MRDKIPAIVTISHCINHITMTDRQRGLLRDVLRAVESDTLPIWGATNQGRADEVRALFDLCIGELSDAQAA